MSGARGRFFLRGRGLEVNVKKAESGRIKIRSCQRLEFTMVTSSRKPAETSARCSEPRVPLFLSSASRESRVYPGSVRCAHVATKTMDVVQRPSGSIILWQTKIALQDVYCCPSRFQNILPKYSWSSGYPRLPPSLCRRSLRLMLLFTDIMHPFLSYSRSV